MLYFTQLKTYKKVLVTEHQSIRFKNGGALSLERLSIDNPQDKEIFRVFDEDEFLGLGIVNLEKSQLKILRLV